MISQIAPDAEAFGKVARGDNASLNTFNTASGTRIAMSQKARETLEDDMDSMLGKGDRKRNFAEGDLIVLVTKLLIIVR